jgi:addiction module HigA family antidote
MALTITEIELLRPNEKTGGSKHADEKALYLLVKEAGKYWRMDYRFGGKHKTLAFGVYPAVSIDDARLQRDKARKLLANGIDPSKAKKEDKLAQQAVIFRQRPKHPGKVLREEVLPALPINQDRMAQLLGVAYAALAELLNEQQPMTCDIALGLEKLLGTSAESWMNMQLAIDLWDARQELDRLGKIGRLLSLADLPMTAK